LKEGLGAYALSYETVCPWVKAIKNSQEETGDAPRGGSLTDECHTEQVKSVLEHVHSTSCMATVSKVGISPSVYHILTNSSEKQKFVQVDSTHAQ